MPIRQRLKGRTAAVVAFAIASLVAQSAGAAKYKYDSANRLRSVQQGQSITTYGYDGWGNISTVCSGPVGAPATCREVMIDELQEHARAVGEVSGSSTTLYVYGPNGVVASKGADVGYTLTDRLGTVMGEVNGSGQLTSRRAYDAWGATRADQGTLPSLGFAGELELGHGLVWLRARSYLPELGRFLQRDDVVGDPGVPQTLNRYAYAAGNPLTRIDPSGHFVVAAIAVVALAAVFVLSSSLEGVNAPMGPYDRSPAEVRAFNAGMPRRVATDAVAAFLTGPLTQAAGAWAGRNLLTAGLTEGYLTGSAILSANGGSILYGAGTAGRTFVGAGTTGVTTTLGAFASSSARIGSGSGAWVDPDFMPTSEGVTRGGIPWVDFAQDGAALPAGSTPLDPPFLPSGKPTTIVLGHSSATRPGLLTHQSGGARVPLDRLRPYALRECVVTLGTCYGARELSWQIADTYGVFVTASDDVVFASAHGITSPHGVWRTDLPPWYMRGGR